MAKFEIFKSDKNNEFYFRLRASNNEIILRSEGYTTKQNCFNGTESVRKNSKKDSNFERKTSSNNQYFFNLLSEDNGQVIGTSEMYVSENGRDNGIASVMHNAPVAETIDLT